MTESLDATNQLLTEQAQVLRLATPYIIQSEGLFETGPFVIEGAMLVLVHVDI